MDEDGTPELCINGEFSFTYIYKYLADEDKFILWHELYPSNYQLNGSGKIRWEGLGSSRSGEVFYKLNKDGEEEYTVFFFSKTNRNSTTEQLEEIYMVGLPWYSNKENQVEITEDMKMQSYFDESHEIYYFRVTEEQYNNLTDDYREAKKIAREKIKEVTYTYDELFSDLLQ